MMPERITLKLGGPQPLDTSGLSHAEKWERMSAIMPTLPEPFYLAGSVYETWRARMDATIMVASCVHEAAHAVVANVQDREPAMMLLHWHYHPAFGYVQMGAATHQRKAMTPAICMAGHAAVVTIAQLEGHNQNFSRDCHDCITLQRGTSGTRTSANAEAEAILRDDWPVVVRLSHELYRRGSLANVDELIMEIRAQWVRQATARALAIIEARPSVD